MKYIDKLDNATYYHDNVQALEKHMYDYFKDEKITVFHEFASFDFHLDVYLVEPKKWPCNVLITSGMSQLAMNVPDSIEDKADYEFAELLLPIPKDITFSDVVSDDNNNDWLIGMLKSTARFAHHCNTFLCEGHTLQATYDMKPYCDHTNFVGNILLPSASFEEFSEFKYKDRKINIYSVFLLYKEELEYKINNSYSALWDLLVEANANDVFNNNRPNFLK